MSDTSHSKPRKLWKILFGLSLALNLIVIGAVGGAMMRVGKGPMSGKNGYKHRERGVLLYMRALSFEDKRALGKELRNNKQNSDADKKRNQSSYRSALAILRAQPFDRDAFAALLEQQAQQSASKRDFAQVALIEHLSNMTQEERIAYAERLEALTSHKAGAKR